LIALERIQERATSDARTHSYHLNPDLGFLQNLLEGLQKNEARFGYPSCPCRFASGNFDLDRDIICPCDYRDPDVNEFGYCYCALFVRKDVFEGKINITPIPERRPIGKENRATISTSGAHFKEINDKTSGDVEESSKVTLELWYCKQCGYLCYREDPPYVCPICKAPQGMFSKFVEKTFLR
jgi:ferredoxin-thioredoxin reductase catalytic subunit